MEWRRREYRHLRVPNHDRVQVIPGVRMMGIRGMALFGRPGETPEEAASRWRLVYVPAFFFRRIMLFIRLTRCCLKQLLCPFSYVI
jgi:hypothetical protein